MSAENMRSFHTVSRETSQQCACGNDARPGQWDCPRCHALAQSIYRSRQIRRRKQAMLDAIGEIASRNKAAMADVAGDAALARKGGG